MKKILLPILLIFSIILITQVFGYNNEKVGDTTCTEIKNETRYPNLSPILISKINIIGDKLNNKYKQKDEIYKDKIYDLYIKLLNENIVKTKYTDRQKEILLRIGDYFVCKKEELNNLDFVEGMLEGAEIDEETDNSKNNTTEANTEISNIQILNITDHSAKVTWEGNPEVTTWLYVKKTGSTGGKNNGTNNEFEYKTLGSGYEFTLFLQGKGETKIHKIDFKTLSKNSTTNTNETPINSTPTTPISSTNNSIGKSKYLEEINLPKCDVNNPEVVFIKNKEDWKNINNPNKTIFCVSPGDYTYVSNESYTTWGETYDLVHLSANGTTNKKRYLILNNGNDIHPAKLSTEQLALFPTLRVSGAYWVIDRYFTMRNTGMIFTNATHNTFNRVLLKNFAIGIWIRNNSHYNTIQNSRFDTMSDAGIRADMNTININDGGTVNVFGTKIINNEFVDASAARINRFPEIKQIAYYNNTVLAYNTIEFTDKKRTDCNGNYDPNGNCIAMEATGFGIKSGSTDPNEPIIVSHNILWGGGFRTDPTFEYLSNKGGFSTAYYGPKYVHYTNNVVFDTMKGILLADRYDAERGTWDAVIKNNIFLRLSGTEESNVFSLGLSQAEGMDVQNNLVKDSVGAWARLIVNYYNNTFANNVSINPGKPIIVENNHGPIIGLDTNKVYNTPEEAGYTEDFVFTADRFTNKPREITLENVLK